MRHHALKLVLLVLCALTIAYTDTTPPAKPKPPPRTSGVATASYQHPDWSPLRDKLESLDRWYTWASLLPPPKPRPPRAHSGSHRGYATAKECVSMVEHGGSYDRSSNPSHFGRFQFSRPTWAAYGGDPATWGTASPEEQDAVFERAWNSPGGHSNWLPYDGCGPYDGS